MKYTRRNTGRITHQENPHVSKWYNRRILRSNDYSLYMYSTETGKTCHRHEIVTDNL